MKKVLFTLIAFISYSFCYSQHNLNDYKYVIVPKKFDFQKKADEYNLNQLTKFLFKKHGFETLIEDQPYPEDLKKNNCLALKSNITSKGIFKTKSVVTLHNCDGEMIYKTDEGVTKEKEYKKAYNLSIRKAFESFNRISYKYVPNSKYENVETISEKKKIEKLETEIKALKKEKKATDAKIQEELSQGVISKKHDEMKKVQETNTTINKNEDGFNVKEIFNGYKLFDNSSKEIMTIFDSGVENIFIVKGKDAIIYKKGNTWIYSETNETNLLTKIIKINF